MGDWTGDSFRGWVYALGLCWGWGALGLLVCLSFAFRRASCRDGASDCWDVVGRGVCFVGVCFRFGKKLFGAAYHLHDECHIFNIFGVTVWGE